MVGVGPAVHIIDHVFEDDSEMIDGQGPGKRVQNTQYHKDEEEKVDAASIEAPL
jgi:hypothetical protein